MNSAFKAALLSALVFPGSGHFYLGRPIRGSLFATIAVIALYFLLAAAMGIARDIAARIQAGELPLDLLQIHQQIYQQLTAPDGQDFATPIWLMLGCWVVATVDAFRLGRQRDKQSARAPVTPQDHVGRQT